MTLYKHILKDINEKKAIYIKTSWSLFEVFTYLGIKKHKQTKTKQANVSIINQILIFSPQNCCS